MKKNEIIERRGEAAYEKTLEQVRAWYGEHQEEVRAQRQAWREAHPEEVISSNHEGSGKGGKRYEKKLIYQQTGLQGARNIIRRNHARQYQPFKKIIAPESQCHHQWIPETSKYTGVALVEADQHMHGIIDVIKILKGEITLFTEKEIRGE